MTKKRLIATSLTVMVIFVVLFSSLSIVENANHDCIGDDCPICYAISLCENVLKTVGLASAVAIFTVFVGTFMLFLLSFTERAAGNISLVTLKVKLSN